MARSSSFDADIVTFVTHLATEQGVSLGDIVVPHRLGRAAAEAFIVYRDGAVQLARGTTPWTATNIYLTADVANVTCQALVFGQRVSPVAPPPLAVIATGTYTGDGTNGRLINTKLSPSVVFLQSGPNSATARMVFWKSPSHAAAESGNFGSDSQNYTNAITGFLSGGFTVDSGRGNITGDTYYWVAFAAQPGILKAGSYTGNSTDNRNITGLGFAPDLVYIVATSGGYEPVFKPGSLAGDATLFIKGLGTFTNRIQALQADGFQVGSSSDVNVNLRVYFYFALKRVTGSITTGTYTGNAVDGRDLVQADPFQPNWVWIKDTVNDRFCHKMSSMSGDLAFVPWNASDGTGSQAANRIQAMNTDGFELGTDALTNGWGNTYHYLSVANPA